MEYCFCRVFIREETKMEKLDVRSFGAVGDVSEKYAAAYVREFNYIDAGRFVMELNLTSKDNGAFIEYRDVNEKTVYMLKVVDGKWSLLGKAGKYTAVADAVEGNVKVRAFVNLNTGKSKTFVNNKGGVDADLISDNVLSFRAGIDEKGICTKTNNVLVEVDPQYFRPAEVEQLLGDPTKAKTVLGWNPTKTSFPELIRIMMEHDMELVRSEK